MMEDSTEQTTKNVTADDVAALAGVSRWTVNRAFRREASISEKSRKKVMEAAEQLGYVPDLLASSMKSTRSNLVALLVDDFANPHKLVMLERLTRILRKHRFDTLLVNTLDEDDAPVALLNMSQRRVDAAVLIGSEFNDKVLETALGAQRIRKLVVFARNSSNKNTISICCDDSHAMKTITDYVIERGYKKPLFIAGPQASSAHLMRREVFSSIWNEKKGETPPHMTVPVYDPQLAFEKVTEHLSALDRNQLPDILVCENDALAMGAIDAVRFKLGLRVPEDIAVTGFDDIPQAINPNYQITSYRQPLTAMAEGLLKILEDEQTSHTYDEFKGQIVVRESA